MITLPQSIDCAPLRAISRVLSIASPHSLRSPTRDARLESRLAQTATSFEISELPTQAAAAVSLGQLARRLRTTADGLSVAGRRSYVSRRRISRLPTPSSSPQFRPA